MGPAGDVELPDYDFPTGELMESSTLPRLHKQAYKVIQDLSTEGLAIKVAAALQEGWKVAGGIAVYGSTTTRFLQAVTCD
jgi:hypothetical protein